MNKLIVLLSGFLLVVLNNGCQVDGRVQGRKTLSFNEDWSFAKDLPDIDYSLPASDISQFVPVTLPHTANIEPLVVNNQWMGTCWYRKTFSVKASESEKKRFLYFEGAMQNADIYLNGKHLMHHTGGYLPFEVPISDELNYDKPNLLAVKLINTDDSLVPPGKPLKTLDFNRYGGIYRNVKLIETSPLHITNALTATKPASGGVFIEFKSVSEKKSQIQIKTQIINESEIQETFIVEQRIKDYSGKLVAQTESSELSCKPQEMVDCTQPVVLSESKLWSPDHPYLYSLETRILKGKELADNQILKFGIRDIVLTDSALYLNGKKLFITGTNRHQEYPYIGYALSDEAQWRDAVKIKNAGFNMVRLSHYPQSEAFMDACDSLGIITMDCIPGWQFIGNEQFKQHVLKDTRELIRRDRNQASVFFWELSLNETWMLPELMDRILTIRNEEFPDHQPIACSWIDYPGYELFTPARQHGKPPYYWNAYKDGKRPVFIAEYGDWEYYAQNAGFNQTAYANLKEEERTSRQLRGAGEKQLLQQALNFQEAVNSNQKGESTIGEANWLMFDYNRGYTDDIESSGIADIFRIPKFAYYFYQSQRDASENVQLPTTAGPMVYIASYWQPGSSNDIRVFSNCQQVELLLNGKSLGKQQPDSNALTAHLNHPPFTFYLPLFVPGELVALGFIDGKQVATDTVQTPLEPQSVQLQVDESGISISKIHDDVVYVYAKIVDKNGTICPLYQNEVKFSVSGNAELIGENPAKCEAGIATILLKTHADSKQIMLAAESNQLENSTLQILK